MLEHPHKFTCAYARLHDQIMTHKTTITISMLRLIIDWNMSSILKAMPLLLVTQMKNSKRWIHSNMELTCRLDSIYNCNIGDEGDNDNTANTVSSSINMDDIKTKGTGTVSGIVTACDTDASHQNRTDDLDLAKFLKHLLN